MNYVRHRGLNEQDVFLASYPKSGNTWLKFMLAEMVSGEDVDFRSCELIIPHVGFHRDAPRLENGSRIIKTHEKFRREYRKAIYIVRDGRDVAVSYYHQWLRVNRGDFQEFLRMFVAGEIDHVGPWQENVQSWIGGSTQSQVEIVRYEDCLADPHAAMTRLSAFIGLNPNGERFEQSIERNSKERMREKEKHSLDVPGESSKEVTSSRPFVRKGIAGDWKNHFTREDHELFLAGARSALEQLGYETGEARTGAPIASAPVASGRN